MLKIVLPGDERRAEVEDFIRLVYAEQYQARLDSFPDRLVCLFDGADALNLVCAAGLRQSGDGFYSEKYLDASVENVRSDLVGCKVNRSEIFEVSSLVSRDPHLIITLIRDIVDWGCRNNHQWSFFTVTRRLEVMLRRMGLAPVYLGRADGSKIADSEKWGGYYLTEPRVIAVAHKSAFGLLSAAG